MCLDLLRPTKPCLTVLLGVVLLLIVPTWQRLLDWQRLISTFLSSCLINWLMLSCCLVDWLTGTVFRQRILQPICIRWLLLWPSFGLMMIRLPSKCCCTILWSSFAVRTNSGGNATEFVFLQAKFTGSVGTCNSFVTSPCRMYRTTKSWVDSKLNPRLTVSTYGFPIHVLWTGATAFTRVCWDWSMTKPIYRRSLWSVYHLLILSNHLGRFAFALIERFVLQCYGVFRHHRLSRIRCPLRSSLFQQILHLWFNRLSNNLHDDL